MNIEKPWRRIRTAAEALDDVRLGDLRHVARGGQSLVVIGKLLKNDL